MVLHSRVIPRMQIGVNAHFSVRSGDLQESSFSNSFFSFRSPGDKQW